MIDSFIVYFKFFIRQHGYTLKDVINMYNATAPVTEKYVYSTIANALSSKTIRLSVIINLLEALNAKIVIVDFNDKVWKSTRTRYV